MVTYATTWLRWELSPVSYTFKIRPWSISIRRGRLLLRQPLMKQSLWRGELWWRISAIYLYLYDILVFVSLEVSTWWVITRFLPTNQWVLLSNSANNVSHFRIIVFGKQLQLGSYILFTYRVRYTQPMYSVRHGGVSRYGITTLGKRILLISIGYFRVAASRSVGK